MPSINFRWFRMVFIALVLYSISLFLFLFISSSSLLRSLFVSTYIYQNVNLLIISFFRTDFLIFFYCYDYVRTSGRSLKHTHPTHICQSVVAPRGYIGTQPTHAHTRSSWILCTIFSIQMTVNASCTPRFSDKNSRRKTPFADCSAHAHISLYRYIIG